MNIIIGVTGHPASGKDTVGDYLVSKGYTKITMSDILREEMTKLGILTDRSHIHQYATEMRKKYGNGFLCEKAIKRIKGNTIISGIRNNEELKTFREKLGTDFKLISVTAPIEVRYKWAKERGRIGDDISFERFKLEEDQEKKTDSGSYDVDYVISQADFSIINNSTKEELFTNIDRFISSLAT